MRIIAIFLSVFISLPSSLLFAATASSIQTIEDYNNSLPLAGAYYNERLPSFYTGFAMRVEQPNRIHFRASRGNQIRLTAILDEFTVLSYLYQLAARYELYNKLIDNSVIKPRFAQNVAHFLAIIESPQYKILATIRDYEENKISKEQFYSYSLQILKTLNPGRVFNININLGKAIKNWKENLQILSQSIVNSSSPDLAPFSKFFSESKSVNENSPDYAIRTVNDLLFGRMNIIYLSRSQREQLAELTLNAANNMSYSEFFPKALAFFHEITEQKYQFKVSNGFSFQDAVQCNSPNQCLITYTEFTSVYPNGSVDHTKMSAKDRNGIKINAIRTTGAWNFRPAKADRDVDYISTRPYYGWLPKIDYEIGGAEGSNGIHNPAVQHYLPNFPDLQQRLNMPDPKKNKEALFTRLVSRGPVSHGCIRMSHMGIIETRHIFPSDPKKIEQLKYFGNNSADYDVFDIDADGKPEVMGVDYWIAYDLKGKDDANRREGSNLFSGSFDRDKFYTLSFGKIAEFKSLTDVSTSSLAMKEREITAFVQGQYYFINPSITNFRELRKDNTMVNRYASPFSSEVKGIFPLYEQAYEKDKVQFFSMPKINFAQETAANPINNTNLFLQFARILGRVNGCGPFANEFPSLCNEKNFQAEFNRIFSKEHLLSKKIETENNTQLPNNFYYPTNK